MKKVVRKLLSITLSLVIMFSFAITALAGETRWTGIDGYYYTGTTTRSSIVYVVAVPVDDASVIEHEEGMNEVITWPVGYCVNHKATYQVSVRPYSEQLDIALRQDGLDKTVSSNIPATDHYELDGDLPEKKYSFGAEITVCDVSCTIQRTRAVQLQTCAASLPYATGMLEKVPLSITDCKLIVIED